MRPVLLVEPFTILDKFPQGGFPPLFLPDFRVDKQGEPPPVSSGVFTHGYARPGGCIQGLGVRGNALYKTARPMLAPGLRSSRCLARHEGQN